MSNRAYYALALLLLLVAAALRLWNLSTLPIGFSDAELSQIDLMRSEIQRGNIRVFYELEDGRGQDGLYHSALALTAIAFGEGTFGLRMLSFFLSIISIALLYSLGVRLFGRTAGLAAATMMSFNLWSVLLARLSLVEASLPLFVTAVLLSLARALPVYNRNRAASTNTIDFAAVGVSLGFGLYLHPSSLFMLILAMVFIAYMIWIKRPLSLRRLSYIGFSILMLMIIAIPYFVSSLRLPTLAPSTRLYGEFSSIPSAIANSLLGLFWQGDSSGLYALPQHPIFESVSAGLVLIAFLLCLRHWKDSRYTLILLALIILAPPAMLSSNSPNYLNLSLILPLTFLLFGIAINWLIHEFLPRNLRFLGVITALIILIFNFYWTANDFFKTWSDLEIVQETYNADIGNIAHHLDQTADQIPTVLCYPDWELTRPNNQVLSQTDLVLLHMNNDSAPLRYVDCREGFLFINAGEYQQVVIANPEQYEEIPPIIADWLAQGENLSNFADGTVLELRVQDRLENALGVFITSAPASFETDEDVSTGIPIAPPIRFGGNMTWLGYEVDENPVYTPTSTVAVITYWRVEGLVPSDLTVFTHILSDPVTLVANRDTIAVNPEHLNERDVYLHIAEIPLAASVQARDYAVSIGLTQSSSQERLPVFGEDNTQQGDRIFLYSIVVQALEN